MGEHEWLSNLIYEERTYLAWREFFSFIAAVTELYGPEQATLSAKDWLEELELMDSPSSSTKRYWRAVTIAASARLASRFSEGRLDSVMFQRIDQT
jgi:hypothetical protein